MLKLRLMNVTTSTINGSSLMNSYIILSKFLKSKSHAIRSRFVTSKSLLYSIKGKSNSIFSLLLSTASCEVFVIGSIHPKLKLLG